MQHIINNSMSARSKSVVKQLQDQHDALRQQHRDIRNKYETLTFSSPRQSLKPDFNKADKRGEKTTKKKDEKDKPKKKLKPNAVLQKKTTMKEIKIMMQDNSPDYLLPSNGGYNPKEKSIFVENDSYILQEAEDERESTEEADAKDD